MLFSLLQPPPCICLICNKYKAFLKSSPQKRQIKSKTQNLYCFFILWSTLVWRTKISKDLGLLLFKVQQFSARCSLEQVCNSTVPLPMSLPSISFNITAFPFVIRIASPSHFLCFFFDALHHTTLKYFTRQSGTSWAASSFAVPDVGKYSASKKGNKITKNISGSPDKVYSLLHFKKIKDNLYISSYINKVVYFLSLW